MRTPSRDSSASFPRFVRTPAGRPQLPRPSEVKGAPTDQGGCPLRQRSNTILLALAAGLAVSLIAAALAMAASIVGTVGKDKLTGTPDADTIKALAGNDRVRSLGGN